MIDGMDLVGAWMRQLFGAATAAALVPLAIVAALVVVIAGAGGLGGLGSLGQVISGPEISPAREAAAQRSAARGSADLALVAPPAGDGAEAPVRAADSASVARPPAPGARAAPPPPPPVVTPRRPTGGRPIAPPPAAAPDPPAQAPVASAPQKPPKTLATEVGGTVDKVTVLLEDVVDNLGKTVDGILSGPGG